MRCLVIQKVSMLNCIIKAMDYSIRWRFGLMQHYVILCHLQLTIKVWTLVRIFQASACFRLHKKEISVNTQIKFPFTYQGSAFFYDTLLEAFSVGSINNNICLTMMLTFAFKCLLGSQFVCTWNIYIYIYALNKRKFPSISPKWLVCLIISKSCVLFTIWRAFHIFKDAAIRSLRIFFPSKQK